MKTKLKILLALTLLVNLIACVTESSSDDEINTGPFEVPFEMLIPATQQTNGTWNVTNGRFIASFKERNDVTRYQLQVVREDNTKSDPFVYTVSQLRGLRPPGSDLVYFVVIGENVSYSGLNEERKNEIVAEIQQELNENKHLYRLLAVTPL